MTAEMAMLSARTWVQVSPTTSGVFLHSTIKPQCQHLCHVPQYTSLKAFRNACEAPKKKHMKEEIIITTSNTYKYRFGIQLPLQNTSYC